jgi:hypothetical protein
MSARLAIRPPILALLRPTLALRQLILAPLILAMVFCALSAGVARADTTATIVPSLEPDQLGVEGALTFNVHFTGGEFDVPSPVRHSVLRFPAGLSIEMPELRSCAPARLRSRGASGCPSQAEIGRGSALAEAHVGSQIVTEDIALWVFLGPLVGRAEPTIEILGQGYTPFEERVVLTGTVISSDAPFGEALILSIPSIPTLPLEPDASIVSLSLTLGSSEPRRQRDANTVLVPTSCPAGGFPFATEFTYADGSSSSTLVTTPCPR